MTRIGTSAVVAFLTLLGSASGLRADPHNMCVPVANGVPTMGGPPRWVAWGGTAPVSAALDDPRWVGATGHSFEMGSAKAPLQTRALWASEGGQTFLYMSFIVDVEGMPSATASSPRDLFVGFRRPASVGGEAAYIFQFHLDGTPAAGLVTPAHCARYADCAEGGTTPQNYWRVFVDQGATATCDPTGHIGRRFSRLVGATPEDPPITWMADAVRYWKLGVGEPAPLQNRWAVQVRFPMAPVGGQPLSAGIEPGSQLWYEATAQVTGGGGGPYVSLGHWPRELTTPICPNPTVVDFLVHEELVDPTKYGMLTTFLDPRPDSCDKGLRIRPSDIGSLFEVPASTDLSTVVLGRSFKALKPDGTPGVNTVVAQVENLGSTAVTAPLLARFRLAGWGAAPWSSTDPGKWKDMRNAKDGVCSAGTAPSCTATTIAAGGKGAISFRWQLGDDPTLGASEYCQFGLTPPAGQGVCQVCSCAGSATCDAPTDPGTQSTRPGVGLWPCVSANYKHQCMLVELTAPNGGVDFEEQSTRNNMDFDQMSEMVREALIDARGLPVARGQKLQDIYLIVMPRNMPAALPGGSATGKVFLARQSLAAALRLAETHGPAYDAMTGQQRQRIARQLSTKFRRPLPTLANNPLRQLGLPPMPGRPPVSAAVARREADRLFNRLQQLRSVMDNERYLLSGRLIELARRATLNSFTAKALTHDVVADVGPSAAAEIVPTLEVYAFYRPGDTGRAYLPMTSFSVFLSHEGPMSSITWAVENAQRVGFNTYRLRTLVGAARKIKMRAEAR